MPNRLVYNFDFETRPYHEDASEEEIKAIKDLVFVFSDNIIAFKEMKVISPFSANLVFDQMELLGKNFDHYGILIDLTTSQKPDSKSRRVINKRFKKICEDVEHVSFCTGKNFIINAAARFVMYQTNLGSYSIHKTIDGAVNAIKSKLNE